MNKTDIRAEMLKLRESLTLQEVNLLSNTIAQNLFSMPEYENAGIIYLYCSYRNEADTMTILDKALKDNKKAALPRSYMSGGEPKMDFFYINSLTDLTGGYKGILEPDIRKSNVVKTEDVPDIFIIPGVAYDLNMNRIGYGKGFYDRYISLHNYADNTREGGKPVLAGLCYSFQTQYEIPADSHDIKMDMLITERGIIRGKNE